MKNYCDFVNLIIDDKEFKVFINDFKFVSNDDDTFEFNFEYLFFKYASEYAKYEEQLKEIVSKSKHDEIIYLNDKGISKGGLR